MGGLLCVLEDIIILYQNSFNIYTKVGRVLEGILSSSVLYLFLDFSASDQNGDALPAILQMQSIVAQNEGVNRGQN